MLSWDQVVLSQWILLFQVVALDSITLPSCVKGVQSSYVNQLICQAETAQNLDLSPALKSLAGCMEYVGETTQSLHIFQYNHEYICPVAGASSLMSLFLYNKMVTILEVKGNLVEA